MEWSFLPDQRDRTVRPGGHAERTRCRRKEPAIAHDVQDERPAEQVAVARVGALIRRTRESRGQTLEALATRAGVSPGLLSQVERGMGNPSFRTLHKVAGALHLRVADLMSEVDPERQIVVRADERRVLEVAGLRYELLVPDLSGQLEVLATTLPPGFSNEQHPFDHEGEECVVVMSGGVTVTVGDQSHDLAAGDAVTYDPSRPHWWHNANDREARVLGVVTPPTF